MCVCVCLIPERTKVPQLAPHRPDQTETDARPVGELRFTGTVWLTRLGTGYWLSYFYWMCHKTDNNNSNSSNNWKMFWFSTRLAWSTSNGWTCLPGLPGLLGLPWSVGSTGCPFARLPPSAVYQLPAGMCDSLSCRNWQLEPVQTPPSP